MDALALNRCPSNLLQPEVIRATGRVPSISQRFGLLMVTLLSCTSTVSAQSSIQFEMPLIVNQALSGNINATITEISRGGETETVVTIPKARFRTLVEKFANDEQLDTWLTETPANNQTSTGSQVVVNVSATKENTLSQTASVESSSEISLYQLRQRGLKIEFNSAELLINSKIPRLGTQTISIRGQRSPLPSDGYAQAELSSGLNININNQFFHRDAGQAERGFSDTNVNINGFTNLGGFGGVSLFYEGNYLENDEKEFSCGDVVLIHDSYKNGVRFALGDVSPNALTQQSSADLLGFSIQRNYEQINPLRNLRPSGRNSFTIDRPSTVSFEVNGRIVETLQLEPGSYSAQDFPLAIGANNVRVFVDDGSANIEVANFSAFSNLELLAPGLSNFGINIGAVRDTSTPRARRYTNDIVALGSYQRGLSQNLTVSAQAEVSKTNALVGSSATYGSRHGIFGIELATSKRDSFDDAIRSSLSYTGEFSFRSDWRARADIQLDYQSKDFGGVTTLSESSERTSLIASLGVSKAGYNMSLNTSSNDTAGVITNTISTGLSKSYRYFDLSLDYRYSKTEDLPSDENFSISLSKRFGHSTVRGQYQSANDQYRTAWSGPSSLEAGQGRINNVELIQNEDLNQARLNASYTGSRFIFSANHSESRASNSNAASSSISNLSASTSVGFADGEFAIGRPFNEGFLIVSPHRNLRGKKVSIRRSNSEGDLITGTKNLSTTLVPLNGSYRNQRYHLDVEDLPIGYDIGSNELNLFPGFLAAFNYKLGSDASNTLIGKVQWPDTTTPSLIGGKIINNNSGEITTIFTNKTGRFVAERISTGEYTIVFNDGYDDFSAPIVIEQRDEPGLIKLDTLTLEKATQ